MCETPTVDTAVCKVRPTTGTSAVSVRHGSESVPEIAWDRVAGGVGIGMGVTSMKVLDLSQDFGMHTPGFAGYSGPQIRWIKRLAFDKVGGQELTSTLHVGTHLDAPAHFHSG